MAKPAGAYEGRGSPDGSFVVAVVSGPLNPNRIVGFALDGRELWSIPMHRPRLPAVSPDGQIVAVTADEHLVVYDIRSKRLIELGITGENAAWSPDSRKLAYDHQGRTNVYNFQGNAIEIGSGTQPQWAPDGENIAVRAGRETAELVNVKSGARRPLLTGTIMPVPRWSPNGEWMTYSISGGGRWSWSDAAIEVRRIIVRNTKTGGEAVVGRFAKGNPSNYTWTSNPELCQRQQ